MSTSIYKSDQSSSILKEFYNSVLLKWPFSFKEVQIETRFGLTNVLTAGDITKPALVLLHGAASCALTWGGDIPCFMENYFVCAPDIPGEVGKSNPERLSWDRDDYMEWLCDVLEAFQIKTAVLEGISFGGWIALGFAAHYPDRVSNLILLTPAGLVPARSSAILKTIYYSMQKGGADKMKRMVFGKGEISSELSRFFDLIQAHYSPRFGSPPLFTEDELNAIQARVSMISGENDAFFNIQKAAKRLKAILPYSKIVILPAGEHGVIGQTEVIRRFLETK